MKHPYGSISLLLISIAVSGIAQGSAFYTENNAFHTTDSSPFASKRAFGTTRLSKVDIHRIIEDEAAKSQIPAALIRAVIQVESNYHIEAVSHKGAMGLMQLIPATARRFGVKNAYNVRDNIRGGTRYLKYLLHLFDNNLELALAGYNAGEGAVTKYNAIPPYKETKQYVERVLSIYENRG